MIYVPISGSSYIPLPKELNNSAKGLINIRNKDNECFRWCHIRHLNQDKDPQRVKKVDKQYVNKLDYSGIEFPIEVKHYNRIEKQNSININVFGYENKQPYPIYISKENNKDSMNLLMISRCDDEHMPMVDVDEKRKSIQNDSRHYVLIKDFNKFMYNETNHKDRKHFCMRCLQYFSSKRVLSDHIDNCIIINGEQAVKMPEPGKNIF